METGSFANELRGAEKWRVLHSKCITTHRGVRPPFWGREDFGNVIKRIFLCKVARERGGGQAPACGRAPRAPPPRRARRPRPRRAPSRSLPGWPADRPPGARAGPPQVQVLTPKTGTETPRAEQRRRRRTWRSPARAERRSSSAASSSSDWGPRGSHEAGPSHAARKSRSGPITATTPPPNCRSPYASPYAMPGARTWSAARARSAWSAPSRAALRSATPRERVGHGTSVSDTGADCVGHRESVGHRPGGVCICRTHTGHHAPQVCRQLRLARVALGRVHRARSLCARGLRLPVAGVTRVEGTVFVKSLRGCL